ncbi:class I SAM-dependent methyltransferase [Pseudomonas sp. MAG002Y]|uniref:class I SAM-dependent methyltransferase n=1 Tax=Pseudomonas sp. MAG002Y TaxID=2678690 RepID=UPI001C60DF55|nr:class I SAM-dependent methyltransferase [Pseudomonas sp. MAG002Y]MBW5413099.1 methyltransferase domain-containing protein [Pseudomonas sp. MAG002Y]
MLRPNNSQIDFKELNARIAATLEHYQQAQPQLLPRFDPSARPAPKPLTWNEVIGLEDEELLKAAYLYLLGRPIDKPGLDHYLERLRIGEDKFEILAQLSQSSEGKAHNASAPGLRRAQLKLRLRRWPVIGKVALWVMGLLASESRHRVNNSRFNYITRTALHHAGVLSQQNQRLIEQQQHLTKQDYRLGDLHKALADLQIEQTQLDQRFQQRAEKSEQQAHLLGQRLEQALRINQELRARLADLESKQTASSSVSTNLDDKQREKLSKDEVQTNLPASSIPDSFYLAFENRFRGSEEDIAQRLSYYLPIIEKNVALQEGYPLIDIGCGRGEWLKLLPESVKRLGVDLNTTNVKACLEQGLQAHHADALIWLAQQQDESLGAVSAFHVIEHISFEQLNQLLDICMRKLAPGGMILFETPNPENLVSGTTHFWTDPTHIHPLPPAFVEFFCEFKGFDEVSIHRVNAIPAEYALIEDSEVARRCNTLFYGPQDYSVCAVKRGASA